MYLNLTVFKTKKKEPDNSQENNTTQHISTEHKSTTNEVTNDSNNLNTEPQSSKPKKFDFIKKKATIKQAESTVPSNSINKEGGNSESSTNISELTDKPKKGFNFIKPKDRIDAKKHDSFQNSNINDESINKSNIDINQTNNDVVDQTKRTDLDNLFNSMMNDNSMGLVPEQTKKETNGEDSNKVDGNLKSNSVIASDILSHISNDKYPTINQQTKSAFQDNTSSEPKKKFGFIKKKNQPSTTKVNEEDVNQSTTSIENNSNNKFGFIKKNKTNNITSFNQDYKYKAEDDDDKSIITTSNYEAEKTLIKNLTPNDEQESPSKTKFGFMKKTTNTSFSSISNTPSNIIINQQSTLNFKDRKGSENLRNDCTEEVMKSKQQLQDIYMNMYYTKKSINKVNNNINGVKEDIKRLNSQSQDAIENEDYEKAALIEEELSNKIAKEDSYKQELEKLNKDLTQLRERELMYYSLSAKAYNDIKDAFTKMKIVMDKELEDFKTKDISKQKNTQFKIKKMKEKLENLSQNLEVDQEILKEEEVKIDSLIKSQSTEVFNELDKLNSMKSDTLNEIEELKRKLEEKYNIVDNLNIEIEAKENEIDAIKSNFKPEFKKLNLKRKNVEEAQKDYDEQTEELKQMEIQFKKNEEYNNEKHLIITKKLEEYSVEVEKYMNLNNKINNTIEELKNNFTKENEYVSKVLLSEMSYEQALFSIEATKNEIILLEHNNKKLESEIIGLDLKVPGLEEEKIKFVTAKNFKEAGKVSGELKKLQENKIELKNKIEENNKNMEELKVNNELAKSNINKIVIEIDENKQMLKGIHYEGLVLLKLSYQDSIKSSDSKSELLESLINGLKLVENEILELEKLPYIKEKYVKFREEKLRFELEEEERQKLQVDKQDEIIQDQIIDNEAEIKENSEEIKNEINEKNEKNEVINEDNVENKDKGKYCIYILSADIEEVDIKDENIENEKIENIEEETIKDVNPSNEALEEFKNSKIAVYDLNLELEKVVANEDYDEADRIQSKIDGLNIIIEAFILKFPDFDLKENEEKNNSENQINEEQVEQVNHKENEIKENEDQILKENNQGTENNEEGDDEGKDTKSIIQQVNEQIQEQNEDNKKEVNEENQNTENKEQTDIEHNQDN